MKIQVKGKKGWKVIDTQNTGKFIIRYDRWCKARIREHWLFLFLKPYRKIRIDYDTN